MTILATLILKETIKQYIDNGNCVFSCFLDLSKAFERVENSILIGKLRDKRVPDFIINILCSIFSNSLAKVYINGCFSQSWLLRKGTRQCGILSAYLFNINIDSILSRFSGFNNGCILGINKVNIQAYADDIVLLSPTRQGLQFLIDQISIDFNAHCLEVNTKKLSLWYSAIRRKLMIRFYVFILTIFSWNVFLIVGILGIILNFTLCDSLDMVRATGSFNRSFGFLFRKFNSLSIGIFYKLFLIHCTSFYASELWFDRYKCRHHFNKAAVSYHYSLKKI